MTIEAGLTEFAEYLGGEIRRVENKIPTVGGQSNSPASAQIITGEGRPDKTRIFSRHYYELQERDMENLENKNASAHLL